MRSVKLASCIAASLLLLNSINNVRSDDSFNSSIATDISSVTVSPTKQYNTYTLSESTNLVDWVDTQRTRGTESNLVFQVNKDVPRKFFRATAVFTPLSTTNIYHYFRRQDQGLGTVSFNERVFNYSSNLNVNVTWIETYNPTYASYGVNMPFTQMLTNGLNIIQTIFYNISLGTGQHMGGNVNLEVVE